LQKLKHKESFEKGASIAKRGSVNRTYLQTYNSTHTKDKQQLESIKLKEAQKSLELPT
jgi:hypothetical protein